GTSGGSRHGSTITFGNGSQSWWRGDATSGASGQSRSRVASAAHVDRLAEVESVAAHGELSLTELLSVPTRRSGARPPRSSSRWPGPRAGSRRPSRDTRSCSPGANAAGPIWSVNDLRGDGCYG